MRLELVFGERRGSLDYDLSDGEEVLAVQTRTSLDLDMDAALLLLDFAGEPALIVCYDNPHRLHKGRPVVSNAELMDIAEAEGDSAMLWVFVEESDVCQHPRRGAHPAGLPVRRHRLPALLGLSTAPLRGTGGAGSPLPETVQVRILEASGPRPPAPALHLLLRTQ